MKLAMITAGGAGMFCGSCMQDNTLVRTLRLGGMDAVLVPAYTPIRVDEENVSSSRVFLGGINVYLDSAIPGWKRLPPWLTRWLNHPSLIRLLSRLGGTTDASKLGSLTLDLLKGENGPQQREIQELISFLLSELQPDVILFSNALLSGIVPVLKREFKGPILTLLQGDDIFLEGLLPEFRTRALSLMSQNCRSFDGVLTHSNYYSDFMSHYLNVPRSLFRQIPLTVDVDRRVTEEQASFQQSIEIEKPSSQGSHKINVPSVAPTGTVTIGYFARICPEKGVFRLLQAAETILPQLPDVRIVIAGFLPEQHRKAFLSHLQRLQSIVGEARLHWAGSPESREEKFRLLRTFDMLCVPTEYREPKGLYVLEAALCGVPSILPDHGSFPERIADLGAGVLYSPVLKDDLERVLTEQCTGYLQQRNHQTEDIASAALAARKRLTQRVLDGHSMLATGPKLIDVISGFL